MHTRIINKSCCFCNIRCALCNLFKTIQNFATSRFAIFLLFANAWLMCPKVEIFAFHHFCLGRFLQKLRLTVVKKHCVCILILITWKSALFLCLSPWSMSFFHHSMTCRPFRYLQIDEKSELQFSKGALGALQRCISFSATFHSAKRFPRVRLSSFQA